MDELTRYNGYSPPLAHWFLMRSLKVTAANLRQCYLMQQSLGTLGFMQDGHLSYDRYVSTVANAYSYNLGALQHVRSVPSDGTKDWLQHYQGQTR
jgi:hypothetical protein